jgi:hypothetical protein
MNHEVNRSKLLAIARLDTRINAKCMNGKGIQERLTADGLLDDTVVLFRIVTGSIRPGHELVHSLTLMPVYDIVD